MNVGLTSQKSGNKASMAASESESAALALLNKTMLFAYPAAFRAAAALNVADHLADGPKSVDELARLTGTDALKLYRVLRVLAAIDVFGEIEPQRFILMPAGQLLRSNDPISLRSAVLMITDETFWRPSGEICDIVVSAKSNPVFRKIFGKPFFEHWAEGKVSEDFHKGMASMSEVENRFLVRSYPFPPNSTVVDVAGGLGGLLLRVLQENSTLHGILFDRPHVLARHRLGELGDDGRWSLVEGDFFQTVPRADLYLLKYIMHDWSDEDAVRILRNCRQAMAPGGRVLVMDPVIPPGNAPDTGKLMDLCTMAIYDGGRERTEAELRQLFAAAGLHLERIVDTGSHVSIVEGVAA